MSKKKIGTIRLSENTFLSDPCYGTESMGNDVIKTLPGEYDVFITRSQSKDIVYKGLVSSVIAVHKDYIKFFKGMPSDDKEDIFCAVDTACCGIFNGEYYEKTHTPTDVDEDWYQENVILMDDYKITEGLGVITSSAQSDGCYPVFAEYVGDEAFAIRIKYL